MMQHKYVSKRAVFGATLLVVSLGFSLSTQAFPFFKKKKKATPMVVKDAYTRAISDAKTDSAKGSFISFYRTEDRLLVELPPQTLGRDMLIGATISSVSNPQFAELGFNNGALTHIRFVEKDSAIVMEAVNSEMMDALPGNTPKRSEAQNYRNLDFFTFPIKARNKKTGGILFDASSLFLRESRYFPVISKSAGPFRVDADLKDNLSRVTAMKVFDTNACVQMERNYITNMSGGSGNVAVGNYPVSIGVNFTLALLPEKAMKPRLSDTRVGMFLTPKSIVNNGLIERVSFVNRWRIEPKDTAAYFAGQLTEPVKPIVYYVENTFPALWKKAIKAGILRWNKAFERIGFKHVMQVKDFPTDDPSFDPDNFKYSCIRYLPVAVENAMGPSWVDPRTGEIVTATVLVYNDVVNTINNWRFVQTAQRDPAARAATMPDSLMASTLEYIIAHEVGHTLGFPHNMGASAAFPTDSLRSATFTQQYGTTPSIMDYARFNYVAQPTDKGVAMEPPFLGVYDYYALEWAYRVFPHSKSYKDDIAPLNKLVEAHANDPMYRYGMQQTGIKYDDSSIEEDLGNDPVKSSNYGLQNLTYILKHFDEWIPDGEDGTRKAELYRAMASQSYGYMRNVYAHISGIHLLQSSESSGLPRYQVVPKAQQRAAALWMLDEARRFGKRGVPEIEQRLPQLNNHPYKMLESGVQEYALSATPRLALTYYLDSTSYSPLEYCDDVYRNVWAKTLAGEENLDETDRALQNIYVEKLRQNVDEVKQIGKVRSLQTNAPDSVAFLSFGSGYGEPESMWTETVDRTAEYIFHYAQHLKQLLEARIATTRSSAVKAHYELLYARVLRYLNG